MAIHDVLLCVAHNQVCLISSYRTLTTLHYRAVFRYLFVSVMFVVRL
jgi:hypothetical protein